MLPLLQIKNLTVEFPEPDSTLTALNNFSMELAHGEMLAVVGESGSGKSVMSLTLMNLLSSAARVKSGSILFAPDGKQPIELLGMPEIQFRRYRGSQLAMIFQEPMTSLNPVMKCGEQLIEPLLLHKNLSRKAATGEGIQLLQKVQMPDPEIVFNKYPHQLSGGQKQRVMIAMALSCRPAVLICDEPTTALDVRVQKTILDLLRALRVTENIGMIFITHDLGLVADMADRGIVMRGGEIMEEGPIKELFSKPKHPYTQGLLQCRPSLHPKGERLPIVADFLNNISANTTPPVSADKKSQPNPRSSSTEILVAVKGLNVRYGSGKNWMGKENKGFDALKDIHFDIYKGETLGIVGESGSGKSTLGRALLGLIRPLSGSIKYNGKELLELTKKALRDFRNEIQIVFQDPYSSLNPRLKIGPAISESLLVHATMAAQERKNQVMDLLKKVDLKPEHFHRYPFAFSGGQRQRIVIARALILNPGFVVFDESVSALDLSVQAQILNLINELREKLGFTSVFISHDLSVVRWLCDRVLVLEKGRIVESGEAEAVYLHPKSAYTRALIDAIPGKTLLTG